MNNADIRDMFPASRRSIFLDSKFDFEHQDGFHLGDQAPSVLNSTISEGLAGPAILPGNAQTDWIIIEDSEDEIDKQETLSEEVGSDVELICISKDEFDKQYLKSRDQQIVPNPEEEDKRDSDSDKDTDPEIPESEPRIGKNFQVKKFPKTK